MIEVVRSFGERTKRVPCERSDRPRPDDQIVDLFLKVWEDGRYTHNLEWLRQDLPNVEVIATDAQGVRIAIEHTRLYAYEDHKDQEIALRPVAEILEAEPQLQNLGRHFDIRFQGHFLGKLLRRSQNIVTSQLHKWAIETLPTLKESDRTYAFEVPILVSAHKKPKIQVHVDVSEPIGGIRSVRVGGYLPTEPERFVPIVRKALEDKLEKLTKSDADLRALLLELPIINETPSNVIDILTQLEAEFPKLEKVNYYVVANTIAYESEGYLLYWVWDRSIQDWSEILQPVLAP